MFEVEVNATANGDVIRAVALDAEPNGFHLEVNISNGEITSVNSVSGLTTFGVGLYQHCLLKMVPTRGALEFVPMPYKPTPYPVKDLEVDLLTHPDGKVWAIALVQGTKQLFYANEQTEHRLVSHVIKSLSSVQDSIEQKLKKGYVYRGKAMYDALNRKLLVNSTP